MELFSKLILAHLLVDFVLISDGLVEGRKNKLWKNRWFYYHILSHTLLIWIAFWDLKAWYLAIVVGLSHATVDLINKKAQAKIERAWLFFIDQGVHFLILIIVWLLFTHASIGYETFAKHISWIVVAGFVFVTFPVSVIIKIVIGSWSPLGEAGMKYAQESGLQSAGRWIGIVERILVLCFVLINQWAAVGFLLASKSVFRFGDLREARDMRLTEYVLIGTLLSFGTSIIVGILIKYLMAL